MKDTDYIADGSSEHDDFVNDRMGELKGILRKLLENFIKFLFASNTGGIIVVATFLKLDGVTFSVYPKIAITCFTVGIFTTSLLLILMLIRTYKIDKAWHRNTDQWYDGKLSWGELNDKDTALTHNDRVEFVLVFTGFAAFIVGAITVIIGTWCA